MYFKMRKSHSVLSDVFYSILARGAAGFEQYLSRGGNKNIQCSEGISVLMYSIKSENRDLFDVCLRVDVKRNLSDVKQNTVLHFAAVTSDIYFLQNLVHLDIDLNCQDYHGNTPLIMSVLNDRSEAAILLLDQNCDPNIKNKDGNTALHLVIMNNPETALLNDPDIPLLETFIKHNACWTVQNFSYVGGCTPLMYAINNREIELVDRILSSCKTEYFSGDLFQLFKDRNQCYKQVLQLKGVCPCVKIENSSTLDLIVQIGSFDDLCCLVQNYSLATSSTDNDLLDYCFGEKTNVLPWKLINILINCGLQLTKHSGYIKLSGKLCVELDEVLNGCGNVPVSLKAQSRTAIRKFLKGGIQEKNVLLPLPRAVKKYILFFNEINLRYTNNINKYFKNKMILK